MTKNLKVESEQRRALQSIASGQKMSKGAIQEIARMYDLPTQLHSNRLICARCGKHCAEVDFANVCDKCAPLMTTNERQHRMSQIPSFEEDFNYKTHTKPTTNMKTLAQSINLVLSIPLGGQ